MFNSTIKKIDETPLTLQKLKRIADNINDIDKSTLDIAISLCRDLKTVPTELLLKVTKACFVVSQHPARKFLLEKLYNSNNGPQHILEMIQNATQADEIIRITTLVAISHYDLDYAKQLIRHSLSHLKLTTMCVTAILQGALQQDILIPLAADFSQYLLQIHYFDSPLDESFVDVVVAALDQNYTDVSKRLIQEIMSRWHLDHLQQALIKRALKSLSLLRFMITLNCITYRMYRDLTLAALQHNCVDQALLLIENILAIETPDGEGAVGSLASRIAQKYPSHIHLAVKLCLYHPQIRAYRFLEVAEKALESKSFDAAMTLINKAPCITNHDCNLQSISQTIMKMGYRQQIESLDFTALEISPYMLIIIAMVAIHTKDFAKVESILDLFSKRTYVITPYKAIINTLLEHKALRTAVQICQKPSLPMDICTLTTVIITALDNNMEQEVHGITQLHSQHAFWIGYTLATQHIKHLRIALQICLHAEEGVWWGIRNVIGIALKHKYKKEAEILQKKLEKEHPWLFGCTEDLKHTLEQFYHIANLQKPEGFPDPQELKRIYHQTALKIHPDKDNTEGANERFQNLSSIYTMIKTAERYSDL